MDTSTLDTQTVLTAIQTIGMWVVFAWLYIQERRAHDETRRQWNQDLRELAGIQAASLRTTTSS